MTTLWKVLKVGLALALVIPVSLIVLATVLGIFGAVMGLAMLALRIAVVGLIGWGVLRLIVWMFRGERASAQPARPNEVRQLPSVDPYYAAAMRELDRDIGDVAR